MSVRVMPDTRCCRCSAELDLLLQGHACGCPHLDYRGCECGGDEFPLCPECRALGFTIHPSCLSLPAVSRVIRPQIEQVAVDNAVKETATQLDRRMVQYGAGTYASKHELYGILMEEVRELEAAVHADKDGIEPVAQELIDIAVVCLFGVACIRAGLVKNKRDK